MVLKKINKKNGCLFAVDSQKINAEASKKPNFSIADVRQKVKENQGLSAFLILVTGIILGCIPNTEQEE